MENFEKYCLELMEYANNLDNKRQDYKHIITEDLCFDGELMAHVGQILSTENEVFDAMGDNDLINYEKWLDNE